MDINGLSECPFKSTKFLGIKWTPMNLILIIHIHLFRVDLDIHYILLQIATPMPRDFQKSTQVEVPMDLTPNSN
jgi:hypothetical protein